MRSTLQLTTYLLVAAAPLAVALSSGAKSCDAIDVCPGGVCPDGMELVGAPIRSAHYSLETSSTSWSAGELITLEIKVTQRQIRSMRNAGALQCECQQTGQPRERRCPGPKCRRCPGNMNLDPNWVGMCDCGSEVGPTCTVTTTPVMETAKYLGLLMYAVKANDPLETKVGSWEQPVEAAPPFAPMEGESCEGKALVQTGAQKKRYTERFYFRAPPAGTGAIVFRVLLKQGETLGGSFYWPVVAGGGADDPPPQAGVTGGDLELAEAAAAPQPLEWVRGAAGLSCDEVCAAEDRGCDGGGFAGAASAQGLLEQVGDSYVCAPPLLSSCANYAPTTSAGGDGWCWFADAAACPETPAPQCNAQPPPEAGELSGLRFCPCTVGRRRLLRLSGDAPRAPAEEEREEQEEEEEQEQGEEQEKGREEAGGEGGEAGGGGVSCCRPRTPSLAARHTTRSLARLAPSPSPGRRAPGRAGLPRRLRRARAAPRQPPGSSPPPGRSASRRRCSRSPPSSSSSSSPSPRCMPQPATVVRRLSRWWPRTCSRSRAPPGTTGSTRRARAPRRRRKSRRACPARARPRTCA